MKIILTLVFAIGLTGCAGVRKYEPMMRKTAALAVGDFIDKNFDQYIGKYCDEVKLHKNEFKAAIQKEIIK